MTTIVVVRHQKVHSLAGYLSHGLKYSTLYVASNIISRKHKFCLHTYQHVDIYCYVRLYRSLTATKKVDKVSPKTELARVLSSAARTLELWVRIIIAV